MPTKVEKDSVTGTETTGHEWDGIKELNTPLPKWWLYTFYASIVFAIVYSVLFPSVPTLNGYFGGLLGYSSRVAVAERLDAAEAAKAQWLDQIAGVDPSAIPDDPDLLSFALTGGESLFADNCAPCHGQGGAGRPGGFPTLADDAWLWGGTHEAIQHTITWGVRNESDDARFSLMPAFGDGILDRAQIEDVAEYVLSLSGKETNETAAQRGASTFEEQCVACHMEGGVGNTDLGAPRLSDAIWLYGDEKAQIVSQISQPKHGAMPAWGRRLSDTDVKMLTVYVHALGGGE